MPLARLAPPSGLVESGRGESPAGASAVPDRTARPGRTCKRNFIVIQDEMRSLVTAFMDAWERADAGAVMQLMADDCVYLASVGPEPGRTYRGRADVARGVGEMLAFEAGGESRQGGVWFAEDRAFAEWDYDEMTDDGEVKVVRGIDVIHMAGGKILSIDAYRKSTG